MALRPGRHAEQRQDRAVQCADRQPAEGRELSRRHRRAQSRRAADRVGPPRSIWSICRAPIRCAGEVPTRRSPATWCWAGSPARPRPTCCCAWRTPRTCASRCASSIELKRVGRPMLLVLNMIDIARRRGIEIDLDKLSRRARRAGGDLDRCAPRRHRRIAAAAWTSWRRAQPAQPSKAPGSAPTHGGSSRGAARGRPHHQGRGRRARRGPTQIPARVDTVLLHPVAGLLILLCAPVRHVPGGVRLGEAADGSDLRRLRRGSARWRMTCCPRACCKASSRTA